MTQTRPSYGVLIGAIFAILLLFFLYSVADVLFLLFIAALISIYLAAFTDVLERRIGVPRWFGLSVALLVSLVGLVGIAWLVVPPVLLQTQDLLTALPKLLAQGEETLLRLASRYPVLLQLVSPGAEPGHGFDGALAKIGAYFTGLFPYLFGAAHAMVLVFSVLVMGVYMTLRPGLYTEGMIALAPPVHRDLVRDILDELGHTLRAWIVGQILAMTFLGTLTWIGLMLLQVPYALAFGVFTGLAVIVPFFGTLISTLLPALFVLSDAGPLHALFVVLLGVVLHLVEANFIHPLIMERQVNLPPVLSILSVLIMAKLLGAIGLLVAVPVLATVLVIVRRIYVERVLEGRGFRRAVREETNDLGLIPEPSSATAPSLREIRAVEELTETLHERDS